MPHLAQQREAVAVGQSEVEDQRGVERGLKNAARLFDRRQDVGLVACRPQTLGQELGELLIVFDDQQPHDEDSRAPIPGPPDPGGQHSDELTRSPLPVKAIRADYNVGHTPVYQAL